jgi:hypothetical protein
MIDEIEVKEILKVMEQKLDRIENLILKDASPRLSRREAQKFMKMGEGKFVWLITRGIVKEHHDYFGERYYLKDELMKVLTEPIDIRKLK